MSDGSDGELDRVTLNLSGEEARQLYSDVVHMDEGWASDGPYASIREKLERQL